MTVSSLRSAVFQALASGETHQLDVLRIVDEQLYARQLVPTADAELAEVLELRKQLRDSLGVPRYPQAIDLLQDALTISPPRQAAILLVTLSPQAHVWTPTGPRELRNEPDPGDTSAESTFRLLATSGRPLVLQHTGFSVGTGLTMDYVDDFDFREMGPSRLTLSHAVRIMPRTDRRGARLFLVPLSLAAVPPSSPPAR